MSPPAIHIPHRYAKQPHAEDRKSASTAEFSKRLAENSGSLAEKSPTATIFKARQQEVFSTEGKIYFAPKKSGENEEKYFLSLLSLVSYPLRYARPPTLGGQLRPAGLACGSNDFQRSDKPHGAPPLK